MAVIGFLGFGLLTWGIQMFSHQPLYRSTSEVILTEWSDQESPVPVKSFPMDVRVSWFKDGDVLKPVRQKLQEKYGISRSKKELEQAIEIEEIKPRDWRPNQWQQISVVDRKKDVPKKILRTLIQEYKKVVPEKTTNFMKERKADISSRLSELENRIQSRRDQKNRKISELEQEIKKNRRKLETRFSPVAGSYPELVLSDMSDQLKQHRRRRDQIKQKRNEISEKINLAESFYETSKQDISGLDTDLVTTIERIGLHENTDLGPLLKEYRNLGTKKHVNLSDYTPQHPEIRRIERKRKRLEKQIIKLAKGDVLEKKLNKFRVKLNEIQEKMEKNLRRQKRLSRRVNRFKNLVQPIREANSRKEQIKREFNKNLEELQKEQSELEDQLAVIERVRETQEQTLHNKGETASDPEPIRSVNYPRILTLAIIFGLFGGVSIPIMAEYFSDFLSSSKDIRKHLGVKNLISVPYITQETKLDLNTNEDFMLRNIFNKFSVFLSSLSHDNNIYSYTIVSFKSKEGKTFFCSNAAISLARSGEKVLLVDADFRAPQIHDYFGVSGQPGLNDLIRQLNSTRGEENDITALLDEYTQRAAVENLLLMPAGHRPDNPLALLKSPELNKFLARLRERNIITFFDTPAMGPVVDASILAGKTDGTILVTAQDETTKTGAAEMRHALKQVGANMIGGVLNKVRDQDESDYYYYQTYEYR